MYKLIWRTFCLLYSKKNPSELLVEQRAKSNEQLAKSNEQQAKSNEQKVTSNEQRVKNFTSQNKQISYVSFLFVLKLSENFLVHLYDVNLSPYTLKKRLRYTILYKNDFSIVINNELAQLYRLKLK